MAKILKMTNQKKERKYLLLIIGLLFDAIGMLSFIVPGIGEFSDVIWAPVSALLIYKMYKGAEGKIGGTVAFFEEIIPGLDIIPTFTLTWIYKFLIKKGKT
jgi:hypothetical protein